MAARIDWQARRADVERLVDAHATLAEIGLALGCSPNTASAGIRRLGLALDPVAVRARSATRLGAVARDPAITRRRTATLIKRLADPGIRQERSSRARKQWRDPEIRDRNLAAVAAATAAMTADDRSARSARAMATRMAWLPAHLGATYAQLRRRHGAATARTMIMTAIAADENCPPSRSAAVATRRLVERIARAGRVAARNG